MPKILNTAAVVIVSSLGFAAMGSAPALATNYHDYEHTRPGWVSSSALQYAGPVSLYRYYAAHPGYAGPASSRVPAATVPPR